MIRRTTLLLAVILVIASISGVFGLWTYSTLPPDGVSKNVDLTLSTFTYHTPEEILPGGSGTGGGDEGGGDIGGGDEGGGSVDLGGANHYRLLDAILWDLEYGLNYTNDGQNKPAIHNALRRDGEVMYCEQTVQPGNMKHVLIEEDDETQNLLFAIKRISSTEYHLYTMKADDAEQKAGVEIEVYKTILIRGENGEWKATESFKGSAITYKPDKKINGINVDTFIED